MADYTAPYAAFKYAVVGITFFNLLAWFLLLGGISSLERVSIYSSRSVLGLPWFILWFQLLLIIAAFVVEVKFGSTPLLFSLACAQLGDLQCALSKAFLASHVASVICKDQLRICGCSRLLRSGGHQAQLGGNSVHESLPCE